MTTTTKRVTPCLGAAAVLALAFAAAGCGGSNSPATNTGGTTGTATGGTTGTATGGTTGTATGGTTGTATGGTTGTATGGSTGTTGAAGSSGSFGQPACTTTSTGAAVKKSGACTAADPQLCYNTCGPAKTGVKSETCSGGTYAEGNCQFDPTADYSCYKIPATPDPSCPTTAIQSGGACTQAACVVCGGTTGYLDSTGASKTGYCVCQAGSSNPTWSCASGTAWPCPSQSGC